MEEHLDETTEHHKKSGKDFILKLSVPYSDFRLISNWRSRTILPASYRSYYYIIQEGFQRVFGNNIWRYLNLFHQYVLFFDWAYGLFCLSVKSAYFFAFWKEVKKVYKPDYIQHFQAQKHNQKKRQNFEVDYSLCWRCCHTLLLFVLGHGFFFLVGPDTVYLIPDVKKYCRFYPGYSPAS